MLADHQIQQAIASEELSITPFDAALLQPASVDLRLGEWLRAPRPGVKEIDLAATPTGTTATRHIPREGYSLAPGEFVLASTVERISLPATLAARVEGKSSLGRLGLAVHITAGFIDPGFTGQITLEIANLAPWQIRLRPGAPVAQLALFRMEQPPRRPYGRAGNHYQGQTGPTESQYEIR